MISFPSSMRPIISNYGFGSSNNIRSIDLDGGSPIQVKNFKYGTITFTVNIVGTRLTKMAFSDFLYSQISSGADSFTMNLDSGLGIEEHVVKIVPGSIQFSGANDPTWNISFNAIAEKTPAQDAPFDGDLSIWYGEYGEELPDLLAALGVYTLEDLPEYF